MFCLFATTNQFFPPIFYSFIKFPNSCSVNFFFSHDSLFFSAKVDDNAKCRLEGILSIYTQKFYAIENHAKRRCENARDCYRTVQTMVRLAGLRTLSATTPTAITWKYRRRERAKWSNKAFPLIVSFFLSAEDRRMIIHRAPEILSCFSFCSVHCRLIKMELLSFQRLSDAATLLRVQKETFLICSFIACYLNIECGGVSRTLSDVIHRVKSEFTLQLEI